MHNTTILDRTLPLKNAMSLCDGGTTNIEFSCT
jgi:hypothetical protein